MAASATSPQPFQSGPRLIDGSDLNKNFAFPARSVAYNQIATGATNLTALPCNSSITQFSTVAANTGALLAALTPGQWQDIYNDGASPLTVYAGAAYTIDGTAGTVGVALANAKRCRYTCLAVGVIESAQLGAVSA